MATGGKTPRGRRRRHMQFSTWFIQLTLVSVVVSAVSGCREPTAQPGVTVRVLESTAASVRHPGSLEIRITAAIRNLGATPVSLSTCVTELQKQVGTEWRQVLLPICYPSYQVEHSIAAGDSLVLPIRIAGFTAPGRLPQFDFGAELSGTYRIVLDIRSGGQAIAPSAASRAAVRAARTASNSFGIS